MSMDRLGVRMRVNASSIQGLTFVHFLAQLEPCLPHKNTLHTLSSTSAVSDTQIHPDHPIHPLNTGYTTPTRTPYHMKSAEVKLRSERV
jgi:hypothetical protein